MKKRVGYESTFPSHQNFVNPQYLPRDCVHFVHCLLSLLNLKTVSFASSNSLEQSYVRLTHYLSVVAHSPRHPMLPQDLHYPRQSIFQGIKGSRRSIHVFRTAIRTVDEEYLRYLMCKAAQWSPSSFGYLPHFGATTPLCSEVQ